MARTVEIRIGETTYKVHALTIGQLERMTELAGTLETNDAAGSMRAGFQLLKIALERTEPKIEQIDDFEITIDEMNDAVGKVMELSGLKIVPPTGAAPGTTAP